jgi:rhodanese-related sulfurtransferase
VSIPEISVHEAQARLAGPQPPRLVDVREEDEWALGHLPGAELLPLSQFTVLQPQHLTDPAEPLLIYCHHGGRSARAAEYLLRQGYTDVTNLAGGIEAWSLEIDPTVPRY